MTHARPNPRWHVRLNSGLLTLGALAFRASNVVRDLALDAGELAVGVARRLNVAALDIGDGCVVVARIADGVGQLVSSSLASMSQAVAAAGEYAEAGRLHVVDADGDRGRRAADKARDEDARGYVYINGERLRAEDGQPW